MATVDLNSYIDIDLFELEIRVDYLYNNFEQSFESYKYTIKNTQCQFAYLFATDSGIGCTLYSDTNADTLQATYYSKKENQYGVQWEDENTPNFYSLNYQDINEKTVDSSEGYLKFSDILENLEEKYNNVYSNKKPTNLSLGVSGGLLSDVIKNSGWAQSHYSNIKFTITINNPSNIPIFCQYSTGEWFGYRDLDYQPVSALYNYNYDSDIYNSMPVNTANVHSVYRHYALAYMLYDDKYKEEGGQKKTFAENVITNIQYDGTKKSSLVISHQFNLEEYANLDDSYDIYKIPGFFVNLAVNIRTVNAISGDNVNVYNLHKIDLPRDGFTKNNDVDNTGRSKTYTYTYGDLVKACNNTVLSEPMKISVDIVQFAEAVDGEPYVIYESPITDEIEINPVQHLYDGDTPASGIVNSIEWSGYDDTDDGDNSGGDGKNDDKGDKSGGTGSGQGTHNVLTTTYVSNATRLQALGDFLWSSSFLDNILLVNNNPIENVISVKMFPFTLPTGADTTIVLGNVDTEVPTNKLPDNYNYYHVYGSVKVPSYYNSFMDYAPFTRILLYLPFYGTLELDNSLIIDRTLKIAYIVDMVTGACTIDIYADDSLINVISCQVGIDIPITSSNRAQVESAILSNTLTSAVSGASVGGGVGAVVGGVGGALLSAGHCKYNTQTSGAPSSATELYNVSVPMLIIDRPKYREISGFAHNKGKMCMLTKKLSDVSGFSIFDRNIDLSGIGATETELEMIRDLLSTGVYL